MIPIFVGVDEREYVGLPVLESSILRRTRETVSLTPMRGVRRAASSTGFEHARWDVPALCGYRGLALWMECDMLCLADLAELVEQFDPLCDVQLVQHDYRTKHPVKFLGQQNEDYPRKNWSSLMLINCAASVWQRLDELRRAKPVNPSELHRFPQALHGVGLFRDERIGALEPAWNHLVGELEPNPEAKVVHFTIGLPIWPEYADCEFAAAWRFERDQVLRHDPAPAAVVS